MKQRITQLLTAAGLFVFGSSVFYGLGGCNRDKSTTESVQAALPEKVDFNFHIKPILTAVLHAMVRIKINVKLIYGWIPRKVHLQP